MYITINKNYYPQTIKMRQSNGWTTIKVSNFKAKNISDATFAALYADLEEAFDAAKFIGDFQKAFEYAAMMRSMEQNDLVPHVVNVQDTVH